MIYSSEEAWMEILFPPNALRKTYMISDHGRIMSHTGDKANGKILRTYALGGYPSFSLRPKGKDTTLYIHRLVAEYYVHRQSPDHRYVIHLDYEKKNNHKRNLRWATKEEMEAHQQKSPLVIASRKKRKNQFPEKGHKLTATDVIRIKKRIFDPNRKTRLKIIAKQFNISEMQLYRIKKGENWGHIRVKIGDQTF